MVGKVFKPFSTRGQEPLDIRTREKMSAEGKGLNLKPGRTIIETYRMKIHPETQA